VTRAVISAPLETSLLALLSLQQSTLEYLDSLDIKKATYALRLSRAFQICYTKVFKHELHEKNRLEQFNHLSDDILDSIRFSLDSLTRTIDVKKLDVLSDDMFEPAEFMLVDLYNRLEALELAKLKRAMKKQKLKASLQRQRRKTLSAAVVEVRFTSGLM